MSDKHDSNAGEGRSAVSGCVGPAQRPGARITGADFVRTRYPSAMGRKQRRMCKAKLGEPGKGKQRKRRPF